MNRRLRILAFEPFDTGSHHVVRMSISRHSQHEWTWITRPGRAWKWRMRLAALEMVNQARRQGVLDQPVDVILATSLMSTADLRAALPKTWRTVPLILYMHENQAVFPHSSHVEEPAQQRDIHFALTNLTSILTADRVIWNSQWNLQSFLAGIMELLRHAPDCSLGEAEIIATINARSQVIWPPVEPPVEQPVKQPVEMPVNPPEQPNDSECENDQGQRVLHNALRVVWPHRWEHDKGPDELLQLAENLTERWNLRWTILGQQFRQIPAVMETFQKRFAQHIDHIGYVEDRGEYWHHLQRCDWVLSTAKHEFFGIAVVEAMLAGCLPWLPDRLSYPELLPAEAREFSPMHPPADADAVRTAIRSHLTPALAENAVNRLDQAIEHVITAI